MTIDPVVLNEPSTSSIDTLIDAKRHMRESSDLFVPNVEPAAPLTPGLGYALGAGRRSQFGSRAQISDPLQTRWWGDEQYRQLEQAVEDVFAGHDEFQTGELVRPFVLKEDDGATTVLPRALENPAWQERDVPPPTPVYGVTSTPAADIPTTLPSRRQLREQRKAASSARSQATRKLAKGGVLAVTMFGVVASNAPQAIHDKLFSGGFSTALAPTQGTATLALGTSSSALKGADTAMRKQSLIEDSLRERLVKQQTGLTVSEAGQDAASVVVAAAKAQSAVDAATAKKEKARALALANTNPKALARTMVADRGWSSAQFVCLDKLWTKESGWRVNADNPTSSAYGIPQALPGRKMASAGADWATNPATQIKWGLKYIDSVYGTPCNAWAHSQATNWY